MTSDQRSWPGLTSGRGREVFFVTVSNMPHSWDKDNPLPSFSCKRGDCFFTHRPNPAPSESLPTWTEIAMLGVWPIPAPGWR